ncbi:MULTISPECIES: hypothetical protein [unclassified Okeania]|uniref:hypothetical protein n=1 Tax=unclassified Okeania TaxID=2634635 RepID=UPI0013BD59B4|nr:MULTISPECIES: hypothetical protein [unclassified Okeania]NET22240.1 hypothetical protein [Okeania sp. SIO1H5]NEP74818.1 hypothetical protein [Okeania sp. SIO2G5]NEP95947.1 hypothetical protein [Okeania sp. SIO2F5]NEQ94132.1 hypothetical protein [Okeania sp. SIO2G4]NET95447.1 hypothetical protein [Okeania sp. SIO1H2]
MYPTITMQDYQSSAHSIISCPVASFVYNRGGRKIIARSDIATQRYRDRYSSST